MEIEELDNLPGMEKHVWKRFFTERIKPLLNENHRLYFIQNDTVLRQQREAEILELLKEALKTIRLYQTDPETATKQLEKLLQTL